jgi:arginine N-succinyltransferase
MPRQPLYVDYLPQDAKDTIGRVHRNTEPARRLLETEGMHFEGYIDIFDAGPVLQARVSELRALRESALAVVDTAAGEPWSDEPREPCIVATTTMRNFRMVLIHANPVNGRIALSEQDQQLLQCHVGDQVRTLSLNVRKNSHV